MASIINSIFGRSSTAPTPKPKPSSSLAVPEEDGGSGRTSAASSLGKKAGKSVIEQLLAKQRKLAEKEDIFVARDSSNTPQKTTPSLPPQTTQPTTSPTSTSAKPDTSESSPYVAGAPFRRKELNDEDLF